MGALAYHYCLAFVLYNMTRPTNFISTAEADEFELI